MRIWNQKVRMIVISLNLEYKEFTQNLVQFRNERIYNLEVEIEN